MQALTIGKLAQRAEVNVETVRYYQRRGLLPAPERRGGGYRLYAETDLRRLQAIRRAKSLGFTLREIRDLLPLFGQSHPRCTSLARLGQRKIAELSRKIQELERARSALQQLIAGCTWTPRSKRPCQSISALTLTGN